VFVFCTALEKLSSSLSASGPRHTSSLETLYLERLVRKHGEDVENMARDRRLNPEQRTPGELRRGIRRAGGTGVLLRVAGDAS
jgi:nucleolar protein 16